MSTTSAPAPSRRAARPDGSGVNFARILRSEWIKVTTVPSTVILIATTLVVMVGLGAFFAWNVVVSKEIMAEASPEMMAQMGGAMDMQAMAHMVPTSGLIFGQLLIASLAVVLIASEYSTGMIRSTMVAVPKRIPALLGKALIIAVIAFVVGGVSALLSYFVGMPILNSADLGFSLDVEGMIPSIINTGTFLALVAIIGTAIGTLLRSTAGGVVTTIGLLMILPILSSIFSVEWVQDVSRFLPSNAGNQLVALDIAEGALNQWQGGLVLAAWAVVLLAIALVVTKRRDV
ncbi:ABC transporter permease subunit [Arthrobacter sp. Helios]|uniref:ABC transporter permease subunit n=1 Tax=Arthrobacter sp. Helios TaxID=2828862 RepID=UPI00205E8DA1|nr:ABC transporter permease subunit [Arthrobacter sp. Helios]UPO76571.1 ABC transporter permease [Arthrobacter sp. Helios]